MFRLSNKIVQVNFQDHTEILLNSENRYVTYVNKKGERQTMPLNQALDSNNAEMTKRLKYTKDILTHMLNNNQQNNVVRADMPEGPTSVGAGSNSSRRVMGLNSNNLPMNGFALNANAAPGSSSNNVVPAMGSTMGS